MPGLIGFTRPAFDDNAPAVLGRMRRMMRHQASYVEDPLFVDASVAASRIHKGIIQKGPQPVERDDCFVWLKGEFYNQRALLEKPDERTREMSDPSLLLQLYRLHRQDRDLSFLSRIDGIYSAVIYDTSNQVVHLITDRYGLGYLYWTIRTGELAWSSEVKAFLEDPQFSATIDLETVEDFFRGGHPSENKTWLEGVELVPPGTVLSWNLREKRIARNVYWNWGRIQPASGSIDESELIEEIGLLWMDSVARRCEGEARIGISLSGGLDSRAILAAMPEFQYPIEAVTVGNPRSADVRYARRAAAERGARHHLFDLNERNWIGLRPSAIWWSDGHIDLKHMHGSVLVDKLRAYYDINLSGIAGGPVMGGLYLKRTGSDREEEFRVFSNRGRRFSPCHVQSVDDVFFHSRLPFYDNALVEAMLSIPPKVRGNHRLYKRMLLHRFPAYYRRIPWQETGLPIAPSNMAMRVRAVNDGISSLAMRAARKAGFDGLRRWMGRQFHYYDLWLRREPAISFVDSILHSSSRLYPNYIDGSRVAEHWNMHLSGRNRTNHICRYVTFEIWLQQVLHGRFRPREASHDPELRLDGLARIVPAPV